VTGPTVLILGGTAEARELAGRLASWDGLHVVSSLAGRVRDPALPAGEVRIGGFGGADGLAGWLTAQEVRAVVDATHPFAQRISASAAAASAQTGTPLVSLVRPAWTAREGDIWHQAGSVDDAARLLPGLGRRAFLTTGRQELAAFAPLAEMWFLIRCVDPPSEPLPPASEVILARGPYHAGAEAALMRAHRIDVLVTKNSGGELTAGKLQAARDLRIPVVMVRRPPLPPDVPRAASAAEAESWLLRQLARAGGPGGVVPPGLARAGGSGGVVPPGQRSGAV
jgi:precorrin-6A/cobalt-precorrin-6A reductase